MPRIQAYAAIALSEAVKIGIDKTSNDPAAIVATAEIFYDFLAAGIEGATPAATPAATKPAAEKPAVVKPAATKPAAEKPAVVKPAATKPAVDPNLEIVKGLAKLLIEANLRGELMGLLDAQGANSATSLVAKGQEAVDAFTTAANDLLATA